MPSVAVIIPCRNAEKWIGRAIQSALDQDYSNLEIIVVDDHSTDSSLDIVKSFGERIRWRTAPNSGACAARNAGLSIANSTYVVFLDADDELGRGFFACAEFTTVSADVALLIGCRSNGKPGQRMGPLLVPQGSSWNELIEAIIDHNYIQTSQMIFRREFLTRIGGWNSEITHGQDVELSLRALLNRPKLVILPPSSFCIYNQHESSSRISNMPIERHRISHADIYCRLTNLVAHCGDPRVCRRFGERLYMLARHMISLKEYDRATMSLSCARRLGIKGHIGSIRHKLLSYILGLVLKHRISEALKYMAARFWTLGGLC